MARRAHVAVFCNTYLPYSQTFIWTRSAPTIATASRCSPERRNADLFPGDVRVARPWYR